MTVTLTEDERHALLQGLRKLRIETAANTPRLSDDDLAQGGGEIQMQFFEWWDKVASKIGGHWDGGVYQLTN